MKKVTIIVSMLFVLTTTAQNSPEIWMSYELKPKKGMVEKFEQAAAKKMKKYNSTAETAMSYLNYNLVGLLERPQLLRYTSPSRGYNWHIDLGQGEASTRKISISICLNEDFVGGELLFFSDELYKLKLPLGKCIAFPSFLSHKVLPVRQGVRWALVAWISGEPFR